MSEDPETVTASRLPDFLRVRGRVRPWLLGEIAIVLVLVKVYDMVRSWAALQRHAAHGHAEDILGIENALGLDLEKRANAWLAGHHLLNTVVSSWYELTHVGVTLAVLAFCYMLRPRAYRPARNALVLMNLIGLVIFLLYPVMPPRLLPGAGYVDSVALAGFPTERFGPISEDQYGAMPSLHVAWAVWVAVVLLVMLPQVGGRWLVLVYPVLTSFGVVLTANHYLVDVVAGLATTVVAVGVAGLHGQLHRARARSAREGRAALSRRRPPPPRTPPG